MEVTTSKAFTKLLNYCKASELRFYIAYFPETACYEVGAHNLGDQFQYQGRKQMNLEFAVKEVIEAAESFYTSRESILRDDGN